MDSIDWLEWLGYLASTVIVISLLMTSIVRLRLVNLAGALLLSIYGFLIGALPVGVLNAVIVAINVYQLFRIRLERDFFSTLPIAPGSAYLERFLSFHRPEIGSLFPDFDFDTRGRTMLLFVLRNTVPAGLFIATREDEDTLRVDVDFVTREYRDFRIGEWIFSSRAADLAASGCSRVVARALGRPHARYLRKVGFRPAGERDGALLFERRLRSG